MRIIEINALDNGAHNNQTIDGEIPVPSGWAIIPEDMVCENFPFGDVVVDNSEPPVVVEWIPGVIPEPDPEPDTEPEPEYKYILNTNSKKIHYHNCSSISTMAEKNKQGYNGSVSDMLAQGYTACKTCNPE